MFISKINQNAFDRNNTKVKDVEYSKAKTLGRTGVGKLKNSLETKAPFHIILNYFKDKAGVKSVGHFLNFGINKKMDKHFEQIEMKSGKMDQSMSEGPKEASMGDAYAKDDNGAIILCFEPSPKSKIPKGKWPKILKELKPYFAGTKAVAVFDGEMISEDDIIEDGETTTDGTEDVEGTEGTGETTTDETTTEENTTTESSDNTEDPNSANRARRHQALGTMSSGMDKIENGVGKVDKVKLQAAIEKYEAALAKLIQEANADGVVDEQEQAEITEVEQRLAELKQNVEENGGRLSAEDQAKMGTNINKLEQHLERFFVGLGV